MSERIRKSEVISLLKQFADSFIGITPSGRIGLGVRLTNNTGGVSVKGRLVQADTVDDFSYKVADANADDCIGAEYDSGIADGSQCLIIWGGAYEVLLKDATLSTKGNWVKTSDVAGRADATAATPPGAVAAHFQEVGHCIESKAADTDVLCELIRNTL